MDNSKVNQNELSYSSSAGIAKVNIYTGRLLYEYPDLTIGNNSYNITVSHIFNSNLELPEYLKTYVGEKFKLNVQQYLYYEDGNYYYLDGSGSKHEFKHLYGNKYFDIDGLGLELEINDLNYKLKDQQNNTLIFKNNKLVESISGTNELNKKIYMYDFSGKLKYVYDSRNSSSKIVFEYNKDTTFLECIKLQKNGVTINKISYSYDTFGNLLRIIERDRDVILKYLNNKLMYVISLKNNSTYCFAYNTDSRVCSVKQGISKIKNEDTINNKNYCDNNNYVNDSLYVGDKHIQNEFDIEAYPNKYGENIFTYNYFDYNDKYTIVENEKNLKIIYYFNELGFTVSELEVDGSINNLRSLEKNGKIHMLNSGDDPEKINLQKSYLLTTTDSITHDGLMSSCFDDVQNYRKYKCSNFINFYCNFWLKINQQIENPKIQIQINSSELTSSKYAEFLGSFDPTAVDAWQFISIPIEIPYQNIDSFKVKFLENKVDKTIKIADMKFTYGSITKYFVGDQNEGIPIDEITHVTFKKYGEVNNTTKYVNSDFYISEKDIQETYFNIFKTRKLNNTSNPFVFSTCDGSQKFYVTQVVFCKNSIEYPLSFVSGKYGEGNRADYFCKTASPDNEILTYGWPYYLVNTLVNSSYSDCIMQVTESNNGKEDDDKNRVESTIRVYYDLNGNILKEEDEYGVKIIYDYKDGCLVKKTMQHEDTNEKIIQSYSTNLLEETESTYRGNLITKYDETKNQTKQIDYSDTENNNLLSTSFGYNERNELKHVTNNINGNNYIKYDKNGKLLAVTPIGWNKNNMYGYLFNYNVFDEPTDFYLIYNDGIKGTNKQILVSRKMDYSNNKMTTKYYRSAVNDTEIDSSIVIFDKYGRIETINEEGKSTIFKRQNLWESLGCAMVDEKYDPYEDRTYKYSYDEFNNLSGYEITYIDDDGETKKHFYANMESPTKVKYGFQYYTSDSTYDDNKLIKPRVFSTRNEVLRKSGDENPIYLIDTSYEYDSFGRLINKKEKYPDGIIKTKITEDITYKEGTFLKESVTTKIDNAIVEDTRYKFEYTYNKKGNVDTKTTTITKGDSIKSIIESYSYDKANRLIRETSTNSSFVYADKTYSYNKDGSLYCESMGGESIYYNYDKGRLIRRKEKFIENNFSYDNYGNCTHYNRKSSEDQNMFWERGNFLKEFKGDVNIKYSYNSEGKRFRKNINGENIEYYYDGDKLIGEKHSDKYISYLYDADGLNGMFLYSLNWLDIDDIYQYHFVKDAFGNIISIFDNDKEIAYYEYDSWGNCIVYDKKGGSVISDPKHIGNINPFRWKSQYYDKESNLYFIQGRYYSPLMKQYISPLSPEVALSRAENIYELNLYSLTIANTINLVYNENTNESFNSLVYDSEKLSKWSYFWRVSWKKFWGSPLGKWLAIGLMIIAVILVVVLAVVNPPIALAVLTAFGKSIAISAVFFFGAAAIAGFRSKKGFGVGFSNYITENWAFSLAVAGLTAILSVLGSLPKALHDAAFRKAVEESKQAAIENAKKLQALPKNKRPTMTSAAVDMKTGNVYLGECGSVPVNINSQMKPFTELYFEHIKWRPGNCAEFNAVNLALNSGAVKSNLVVTTIRVSELAMAPMCDYCKIAMEGVLFVVSG